MGGVVGAVSKLSTVPRAMFTNGKGYSKQGILAIDTGT